MKKYGYDGRIDELEKIALVITLINKYYTFQNFYNKPNDECFLLFESKLIKNIFVKGSFIDEIHQNLLKKHNRLKMLEFM